jgi:hypothetical protein
MNSLAAAVIHPFHSIAVALIVLFGQFSKTSALVYKQLGSASLSWYRQDMECNKDLLEGSS